MKMPTRILLQLTVTALILALASISVAQSEPPAKDLKEAPKAEPTKAADESTPVEPTAEEAAPKDETAPAEEATPSEETAPEETAADETSAEETPAAEETAEPTEEASEKAPSEEESTISINQETGLDDGAAEQSATPEEEDGKPKRSLFIISYDMAAPISTTRDFSADFSSRGMGFEYRFHFTPNIAAGLLIGWQAFETKDRDTFTYDALTINGTQIRTMESMPVAATFVYNFLAIEKKVVPFIGLDLGAYRVWKNINFGWASSTQADWHFGVAPKLGVIFNLARLPVFIGSKFHLIPKTKEMPENYYWGISIGVGLKR